MRRNGEYVQANRGHLSDKQFRSVVPNRWVDPNVGCGRVFVVFLG